MTGGARIRRLARAERALRRLPARLADLLPQRALGRAAVAGLAIVVVSGAGWLVVDGRDRSVDATVRAFFDARRDGDCDRLRELVSASSWSQDGRLDAAEFVDACTEAVGAFAPALREIEVVERGDRTVVTLAVDATADGALYRGDVRGAVGVVGESYRSPDVFDVGTLVREDGGWRVVADQSLLRIGRSPADTLQAYGEALAEGDCEELADLLSPGAWSALGAGNRTGFVDLCAAAVPWLQSPVDSPLHSVVSPVFEISERGDDVVAIGRAAPGDPGVAPDIRLVREGLGWRLDDDLGLIAPALLRSRVLDEQEPTREASTVTVTDAWTPNVSSYRFEGSGSGERRHDAGFELGVEVTFGDAGETSTTTVLVYRFADATGARSYATHLGEHANANGPDVAPRPEPGPGFAAPTGCGDRACASAWAAMALDVSGRHLVAAEISGGGPAPTDELVGRAVQVVRGQIDRL